jgi:hypothetical protein
LTTTLAFWQIMEVLFVFCNRGRDKIILPRIQIPSTSKFKVLKQAYVHRLIGLDGPTSSQSYMWGRRSGAPDHPTVLYDYAPSRAGSVTEKLLSGFCGYLQTDDYTSYHAVGRKDDISHVGAGRTHVVNSSMSKKQPHPKTKRLPPSAKPMWPSII